jgi:hypothetical protein
MKIYKYELSFGSVVELNLPYGAKPISVGTQGNAVVMWATIKPEHGSDVKPRRFAVVPTGMDTKDLNDLKDGDYFNTENFIGTFQFDTNSKTLPQIVGHVFEVVNI